jgi:uridine phosphorylase
MITSAFDKSNSIINPSDFYGKQKNICDKCIIIFSGKIMQYMLDTYEHEQVAEIRTCGSSTPIYLFNIEGMKILSYITHAGSAIAGCDTIEVNWMTGATKFIMFGSAGSLNSKETTGKYVIPTESYREEGLSYLYMEPSDYIEINKSAEVKKIFDQLKIPNIAGRVWTTDSMYRETRAKVEARQSDGCLAVEMELAGVQAVCNFYNWDLYNFLETGDVLDTEVYDHTRLRNANHTLDKLFIAIEIAKRI